MSDTRSGDIMNSESAEILSYCHPTSYNTRRVAVAMSGGVDSSVAAALLIESGFEVAGYTMRLYPAGSKGDESTIFRATESAHYLGIEHHIVDLSDAFDRLIADYFTREYLAGRTPNPCVLCNQLIKWEMLGEAARMDGWELFATGHYVRIAHFNDGTRTLVRGSDHNKDQSYFLWRLDSATLERTMFPLGSMTKRETREMALTLGLSAAEHTESQEICFIPDNDYRGYLKQRINDIPLPRTMTTGDILDDSGNPLGKHNGAAFYTIGQRRGLGVASGQPLYVSTLDAEANTVTLSPRSQLSSSSFRISSPRWIRGFPPASMFRCNIRIRYRHPGATGIVNLNEGTVIFDEPQDAITPGQSAVFYDGDFVLGGGIIEKPL